MNEADKQATSTLLPSSGVVVYSKDSETLAAARNVLSDWRFARVDVQTQEGDINSAISAYQSMPSPDLLIIQTEDIEASLTDKLEELAAYCSENTAAIVIGPVNDVYLYRKLIEMGVSDYLVKPIKTEELADVIAKTLLERIGASGSRLIAFLGAKGGVGATALAEAAAWGVADMLGQKTILLDTSGGWSTLAVGMGFEPSTTLSEAAKAAENSDDESLERMLFKAGDKLSVLASGGDVMLESALSGDKLEKLVDTMMKKYPVVIVDLSHGTPELEKIAIARASQVVVVSTPTLSSLRLARSLVQEIKETRGGEEHGIELIINQQGIDTANEVPKKDIEKAMELKVSSTIGFDSKTFLKAESESTKLTDFKTGAQIVKNDLLPVLQKVLDGENNDEAEDSDNKGGLMKGLLGKLGAKS